MNDGELYQQKMKAQLDEWRADVEKLKAKASGASADIKLKIDQQVHELEEGKKKLTELADASDESRYSVKEGIESPWGMLKSSVKDAVTKFKG